MTIEEVKEMRIKGFKNFAKETLLDACLVTSASKKELSIKEKELSDLEKDLKTELQEQMEVGEQISLELGSTTYTSTMVELDEIGINCDESVLYTTCLKAGLTLYLKNNVNLTLIKKAYKNGTLHPDLAKYIVVTKQQSMKLSKKTKKEEE